MFPLGQGTQRLDKKKAICKTDKQDEEDHNEREQSPQKENQAFRDDAVNISDRQIQGNQKAASR